MTPDKKQIAQEKKKMSKIKTIDINEIQTGEINNSTLVEWFGSDANKASYEKTKKINSTLKTTLLRRAACKCET